MENLTSGTTPSPQEKLHHDAMGVAARCWADPETGKYEMNVDLALAFAKRLEPVIADLQYFCRRVEEGTIRSRVTYARYKKTLKELGVE